MNTPTETLVFAMRALANDIQSEDGVANAAIHEAAQRLEEQQDRIKRLEEAYAAKDAQLSNLLHICRDNDIEVSSYDLIHGRKP